jgi:hypothetical protein
VDTPRLKFDLLALALVWFVGVILGILVEMGFDNIFWGAVIGGSIGVLLGFCFPNVASYVFGGLIDNP